MTCRHMSFAGTTAIVCSRGRGSAVTCSACRVANATRQCDYKLETNELCDVHARDGDARRAGAPPTHTKGGRSLAADLEAWPTPTSRDWKDGAGAEHDVPTNALLGRAATRWPTPTAGDAKASGSRNTATSSANQGVSLSDMVQTGDSAGRRARRTPKGGDAGSEPEVLRLPWGDD